MTLACGGVALCAGLAWGAEGPVAEIERTLRGRPEAALPALALALPGLRGAAWWEAMGVRGWCPAACSAASTTRPRWTAW